MGQADASPLRTKRLRSRRSPTRTAAPWPASLHRTAAAGRTRCRVGSSARPRRPPARPRAQPHVDPGRHAGRGDDLAVDRRLARGSARRRTSATRRARANDWWRRLPSSNPAAASTSEPVHTDVVHVVVSCALRTQSSTRSSVGPRARPGRPESPRCRDESHPRALRPRSSPRFWSVRFTPGSAATNVTDASGYPAEHLVGPDGIECGHAVVQQDGDVHVELLSVVVGLWFVVRPGHANVRAETAAVLRWTDAQRTDERASHGLRGAETGRRAAIVATDVSDSSSSRRAAST